MTTFFLSYKFKVKTRITFRKSDEKIIHQNTWKIVIHYLHLLYNQTNNDMINVVVLYVGDKPKGIWKENEIVSYTGSVWWDNIRLLTISNEDWVSCDIHSIVKKYVG